MGVYERREGQRIQTFATDLNVIELSDLTDTELFPDWQKPSVFEQVKIGEYGEVLWTADASLCGDLLYLDLTNQTLICGIRGWAVNMIGEGMPEAGDERHLARNGSANRFATSRFFPTGDRRRLPR